MTHENDHKIAVLQVEMNNVKEDVRKNTNDIEEVKNELADGRVAFVDIRKDVKSIAESLKSVVNKPAPELSVWIQVRNAFIFWIVPLLGTALLFLLNLMNQAGVQ